jgi:hypothetical protein
MDMPNLGTRASAAPLPPYPHDSNHPDRFRISSRSTSYNSMPSPISSSFAMTIPKSREGVDAPPPLPPPQYIPDLADGGCNGPDIAWRMQNQHGETNDWGRSISSVQPGSSLHGNFTRRSIKDERPDYLRRGDSNLTMRSAGARDHSYSRIDEGYNSMSGTSIGSNRSVSRPFHILWARIR